MSNIKNYSTTAGSNNSAPPNGFPEGQAPSSLNDCGRQMMADSRTQWQDAEWFDWGHVPTRTGNSVFTVPTDQTAVYTTGRRLKCSDASTLYATILSASYTAVTTITVLTDSGSLSASLTAVAVSILVNGNSIPSSPTLTTPTLTSPVLNTGVSGTALATQANQETASSTSVIVSPGVQQYHPSAAKGWVISNSAGAVLAGYNVTSITDNGVGDLSVNWNVDMSTGNYVAIPGTKTDLQGILAVIRTASFAVGVTRITAYNTNSAVATDPDNWFCIAYGDQ